MWIATHYRNVELSQELSTNRKVYFKQISYSSSFLRLMCTLRGKKYYKTHWPPKMTLVLLSCCWNVILWASLRNAQSTPSKQGQHCDSTVRDTPTFPQAWNTNQVAKSTWHTENCVSTTRHVGLKSDITDTINLSSGKVWRDENLKAFQVHDQLELPCYCTLKTKIVSKGTLWLWAAV